MLTAYTYMADMGWTGRGFALTHAAAEVRLEIDPAPRRSMPERIAIEKITVEKDRLVIAAADFDYRSQWVLTVGEDRYARADVEHEQVEGLDAFADLRENGVNYRLYSPASTQPRPLLLFLHGGGEGGTDNRSQMLGSYGAIALAERYPDFYVMAPQGPTIRPPRPDETDFAHCAEIGKSGWPRAYLADICDLIRGMIRDGRVDRRRVYVTGLSMGGAGTLRAMSVGAGLFAAGAPVCPSMTPETYAILCGLVDEKLWISTAYLDHSLFRHKYIVDGIMALRDAGNQNARLTLYSPEELAAYGIAADPDLPLQMRVGANHAAWVLTYHDEHGILSWLTEQTL